MRLRTFNDSGIRGFRDFLREARLNPTLPLPRGLLEDDSHALLESSPIDVEYRPFRLRADAAEYLRILLEPLSISRVENDAGLWTWLTLFYFDEVCPPINGRRDVKNDYCYIFEPRNPRNSYRHRLHIAWRAITSAPIHNRLFLSSPLPTGDKVTEEVFKRLYLTRIPCIFETLERLYWDHKRGRARRGIVSPERIKAGDLVHRFPVRIQQLERTYDLVSLTADQLIDLLGEEFSQHATPTTTARHP
jgi:hypothetical protein